MNKFKKPEKRLFELLRDDHTSYDDLYWMFKMTIECMETADDCGSVDGIHGMWQEYWARQKPILDEFGGI